jgi:hypothetical protein
MLRWEMLATMSSSLVPSTHIVINQLCFSFRIVIHHLEGPLFSTVSVQYAALGILTYFHVAESLSSS